VSLAGAAAAAACVVLLLLAAMPRSRVSASLDALRPTSSRALVGLRRIRLIAPATLRASGFGITIEQLVAAKLALALVSALLAAVIALALAMEQWRCHFGRMSCPTQLSSADR